jgi:hypothetical protein
MAVGLVGAEIAKAVLEQYAGGKAAQFGAFLASKGWSAIRAGKKGAKFLTAAGKEVTKAELGIAAKEFERIMPGGHVFERHAYQWFGLADAQSFRPTAGQVQQWLELLVRVGRSKNSFEWTLAGTKTVAHIAKVDGKWFVVQYYKDTGTLASAFMPMGEQLQNMLRAAGLVP